MTVLNQVTLYVAFGMGVIALGVMLYDAFRGSQHTAALRFFEAAICFYFLIIYLNVIIGQNSYLLLSGTLSRIGVSLLFLVVILDAWISGRKCK